MASTVPDPVRELAALRYDFRPAATVRRLALFGVLERARIPDPRSLRLFHETLCFARAFPESAAVQAHAARLLDTFADRADLRRHRRALADTGIAGTAISFRFYWLTAIWLVRQGWGGNLSIDWKEFGKRAEGLDGLWHLLLPYTESPALDAFALGPRKWVEALKHPDETDAAFVIRRFAALPVPEPVKEKLYEDLDIPMVLAPGPSTPSRSRDGWPRPIVVQKAPPSAGRPRLRDAIRRTRLTIRPVAAAEGRRLIDLANACMVTRHRDLLVFLGADEKDVRLIEAGDGLAFACFGARPERRLLLESVYGFLTLQNGVPIGYVLNSALYRSAEVAYNVFETFRGRGAAHVYAKILAMVRQLFGAESFAVDPYQLGHGNEEGQLSGAWWFYYKLGFRPHDPGIRRLVRDELSLLRRDPRYRTPPARIDELAADYMYLQLGGPRRDVLGHLPLGDIGLGASRYLAQRFGADREKGLRVCAREAADLLGLGRRLGKLPAGERLAWERWAPLVLALPGVAGWPRADRIALAAVIRAKGGPRESDYVRLFDRHRRLRRALVALAQTC